MRLFIEVVERPTLPQAARRRLEVGRVAVDGDGVGGVGLKLQTIRACLSGGADDFHCLVNAPAVVAAHLSNEVDVAALYGLE